MSIFTKTAKPSYINDLKKLVKRSRPVILDAGPGFSADRITQAIPGCVIYSFDRGPRTIDQFCQIRGVERIDVLRINLAGYEFKELQGATDILKNTELIYFECIMGDSIYSFLGDKGFCLNNTYDQTLNKDAYFPYGGALFNKINP